MKRRTFIKTSLVLTGGGLVTWFVYPTFSDAVYKILKAGTANLNISSDAITRFMKEADHEKFWTKFSTSKKLFIVTYTYSGFLKNILPYQNKYLLYRNNIAGHFLMSTDLFFKKMDVQQKVNYMGFYNPYKQACYHPFSSNFYPETV